MRKKTPMIFAATMILSMAVLMGCGSEQTPEELFTPTPSATNTPEPTVTNTPTPSPAPTATNTPTPSPEPTATNTPTPRPTSTPTPKPTNTPTPKPTEVPIVKKDGNVEKAAYEKAVKAFEGIVKRMRADGLVKETDVCVTMDATSIKVDITFDNSDIDLMLSLDESTHIYTLIFDYNFIWLEGFGPKVNGKDPAAYNKELLIATLSMVSDEPMELFDRIDLDCFSAAGLSSVKWTEIADCFIMSGTFILDESISYLITKEADTAKTTREASYVLTGTAADGATIECVIGYDPSVVAYELKDNGNMGWVVNGRELPSGIVTYMHAVDESKMGPYCYPVIGTGCASYEEYKQNWLDIYKGAAKAEIAEYVSYTANGYTYYYFEGFFMTETEIGDPDIVYVQISDNAYIELYNVMFEESLEDFVNGSFYIEEVTVK